MHGRQISARSMAPISLTILASCLLVVGSNFIAAMALMPFFSGHLAPTSMSFWGDPLDDIFSGILGGRKTSQDVAGGAMTPFNVRVDWLETPDAHILRADVPGFKKSDLRVNIVDGRTLELSGEREGEVTQGCDTWHRVEREKGSFIRRFRLPENVDEESVQAQVENGVLRVTIPKKDKEKADVRSIEISETPQGGSLKDTSGPTGDLSGSGDQATGLGAGVVGSQDIPSSGMGVAL